MAASEPLTSSFFSLLARFLGRRLLSCSAEDVFAGDSDPDMVPWGLTSRT